MIYITIFDYGVTFNVTIKGSRSVRNAMYTPFHYQLTDVFLITVYSKVERIGNR